MKKTMTFILSFCFLLCTAQTNFVKVGLSEYRPYLLGADGKVYSQLWLATNAQMQAYPMTGCIDVAGGQYIGVAIDGKGVAWTLSNKTPTGTQITKDAGGQPFNGNVKCYAFNQTQLTLKADGSVWYWGQGGANDYKMPGAGAAPICITKGIPFVKLVTGSTLTGLTSAGDVYEWTNGNPTPIKKSLPGPASEIFGSYQPFKGAIVGGRGYGWGNMAFFGMTGTTGTPMALNWPMADAVKVAASWNTIHILTAGGDLYGMGDNSQGEVGVGKEWVNHAELAVNPYVWDWAVLPGNDRYIPRPVLIGTGYTDIFADNSWVFYHYAFKGVDVYSWGRNKSTALANDQACNQESAFPNFGDVLAPTLVKPFTTKTNGKNFVPYKLQGGTWNIIGSSGQVTVTGTPTTGYTIADWKWTYASGPTSPLLSTGSATCKISGLVAGAYVLRAQMIDNNGGTISANINLNVTIPQPVARIVVDSLTIHYPNTVFVLTDSSLRADSATWHLLVGSNVGIWTNSGDHQVLYSGLIPGTYTLGLTVKDAAGNTDSDIVKLTVLGPPACAPPRYVTQMTWINNVLTFVYSDGKP